MEDVDNVGGNALHFAVSQNNFELVELFLKRSPHLINSRDKEGWTPLVYAIQSAYEADNMGPGRVAIIK